MNILFINSIGTEKYGGGEKWMIKAAQGLTERGHKVILASRRKSEILRVARQHGVRTEEISIRSDFSPLKTWSIIKYLEREHIDILICNLNKDVRVAGLAARLKKNVLVFARHGILLCGKKLKHKITLTKLTDGIITNTQSIKQAYLGYGWFEENFITVIYNGVEIKTNVQPYDFAKDYPGKKVIFSAGRLSVQKGFIYLLQAAARVKEKRNDVVFVIAGKGRLEHDLKTEAERLDVEDTVKFIGFVDNVDPFIKASTVFLLPSVYEGMPNAVMEAMALGKPVIATDVNGARELIVDGESGIIIPPKDPDAIARILLALLNDKDRRQSLGNAALERVRTHFSVPAMIDALESFLQAKLDESKNN
jgi:glycosyltransferase involved in cell wall biosynthesis